MSINHIALEEDSVSIVINNSCLEFVPPFAGAASLNLQCVDGASSSHVFNVRVSPSAFDVRPLALEGVTPKALTAEQTEILVAL